MEFVSSLTLDEGELEKMFDAVENGQVIEISGCFNDSVFIPVIRNQLDPSGAKLKTQNRVERVKRIVELSKGRSDETYRDFR